MLKMLEPINEDSIHADLTILRVGSFTNFKIPSTIYKRPEPIDLFIKTHNIY